MNEDEPTLDDIPLRPAYGAGPATIEEQRSPFHPSSQPGATIQGMPAVQLAPPVITSRTPGDATVPPVVVAPQIINAPAPLEGTPSLEMPPDGPTVPDGLPALMGAPTPFRSAELGLEEMPTDPYAVAPAPAGSVPSPHAPNIEISKSMEYDVSHLKDVRPPDPTEVPRVKAARRAVAQPTEVMLPALGRGGKPKQQKERSDAWIVMGLLFLVLVIFALIGAVIFGVMQRVS